MSKKQVLDQASGFIYDALCENDVTAEDVVNEIKVVILEGMHHHRTMLDKFQKMYSYFGD